MIGVLWLFHLFFWVPFVWRGIQDRRQGRHGEATVAVHPRSAVYVGIHTMAQVLVWLGMGIHPGESEGLTPQVIVGAVIIQAGSVLAQWTLRTFRSWRVQAEIGVSHQLQTDGPFRYLRNPIYMAMNLLNIGSLVWCPSPVVAVGVFIGVVMGDLRARAEEQLLVGHFGDAARDYLGRVRRFVPGVY